MAHRTLIGGTGYTVTGGTDLIDGTARSRTAGRTLVDGTAYAIGFGGLDADFSKNSWRTIIAACQNKQVPDTWNVGDSCMMAFGKKNYQIDIIGKNHDDYADGSGKAPLTFQMHTCYATEYKMNNSGSNTGGWADCLLRTTGGFKIIKSKMPAEVVAALKAVTKKTTAGGASSAIDTTEDTLFLLSEIEVQGTRTHLLSRARARSTRITRRRPTGRKTARGICARRGSAAPPASDRTGWSGEADWSVASEVDGIAAAWCF